MGIELNPSLLHGRLNAVDDESVRQEVGAVARCVSTFLQRSELLDLSHLALPRAGDRSPHDVWEEYVPKFASLWAAAEQIEKTSRELVAAGEHNSAAATDERLNLLRQRVTEAVATACTLLTDEIGALRERLLILLDATDAWDLIAALREHAKRVAGVGTGILACMFANLPPLQDAGADADSDVELQVALQLRVAFVNLRDDMQPTVQEIKHVDMATWLKPLARTFKTLEQFIYGPAFGWMRSTDKSFILDQFKGLGTIIKGWDPAQPTAASAAIDALAAFADRLMGINHRRILIDHDRQLLLRVQQRLQAGAERAEKIVADSLGALPLIKGRDAALDELVSQAARLDAARAAHQLLERVRAALKAIDQAM